MEIFPNSFYEASIHLYQHQRELSLEKELQINISYEYTHTHTNSTKKQLIELINIYKGLYTVTKWSLSQESTISLIYKNKSV